MKGFTSGKTAIRPIRAELTDRKKGIIRLHNMLDFRNLNGLYSAAYEIKKDGRLLYEGILDELDSGAPWL